MSASSLIARGALIAGALSARVYGASVLYRRNRDRKQQQAKDQAAANRNRSKAMMGNKNAAGPRKNKPNLNPAQAAMSNIDNNARAVSIKANRNRVAQGSDSKAEKALDARNLIRRAQSDKYNREIMSKTAKERSSKAMAEATSLKGRAKRSANRALSSVNSSVTSAVARVRKAARNLTSK